MRNVQSLRANRTPAAEIGYWDTWSPNIEGAAGEMAVAKYLGVYWGGPINTFKADDVGAYQVRTNTSRGYDDMILRPGDPDGVYISVLSFLPDFQICGWIYGHEGKQDNWLRDGSPNRPKAFFVPRLSLHGMDSLPLADDSSHPTASSMTRFIA